MTTPFYKLYTEYLNKSGLSYIELSRKLGKTPSYSSNFIYKGTKPPIFETVKKLIEIFNVPGDKQLEFYVSPYYGRTVKEVKFQKKIQELRKKAK